MSELLNKKAFEISFAVFRVAALIKKPALQSELEKLATEFVSAVGRNNLDEALNLSSGLRNVVRLGEAASEIKQINASVLLREIENFRSLARIESGKDLKIEPLFSQPSLLEANPARIWQEFGKVKLSSGKNTAEVVNNPANPARDAENAAENAEKNTENNENTANNPAESGNSDLILEKVRQLGNCRTKDLAGLFPNLSERTLRGYLKILCDQGLIERLGAGGPDTYYQIMIQEA